MLYCLTLSGLVIWIYEWMLVVVEFGLIQIERTSNGKW
uniref:Uncharacterized protein n=1 Tax=Arundo donax TaxID=35708 RepID=A0A0A9FDF9_ARUDO